MSHKIQKDIAHACAKLTSMVILKDLGDDFFGVLIDESRDISIKEQMIIFLRYVDKEGRVQERCLGIIHVPDTTALTLKAAIDQLFLENGLTVTRIRGQGYDGASNMRGEFNGLKTLILRENQSAYSIHCFAHQLQLTLVAVASKQGDIASFFSLMSRLLNIVGASCRRRDILRAKRAHEVAEQLRIGVIHSGKGLNQEISLQRPTVTRWSSHYKSLSNLLVMFSSVVETLEFIDEEGLEFDQKGEARIMGKLLESLDFVFPLHFMVSLLGITNDLSQALKRRDQDIINVMELVQVTKQRLQDMRNEGWETLLNTISSFCTTRDIFVPNMEDLFVLEGRSRRKAPRITNLHRYRVEIFYATIDFLLQELNNRFNEVTTEFLLCMACFNPSNSFRAFDKQKLLKLAEFYPNEFSNADIVRLGHQLENYIVDMRTKKEFYDVKGLSELSCKLVETGKHIVYPSVYLLLKLVLILPVATASVERAFSSMNYIKNKLRNRMGDKWLNDCLMSYIEREISDNIKEEEIIQYFQRMKTRRLKL